MAHKSVANPRLPAKSGRNTFRAAFGAWRQSQGPRAVIDAPPQLTRSGRNGSWHPPINRTWNDCVRICNTGGLPQLSNWFRFPSSRTDRRPLESLAAAERRIANTDSYIARMRRADPAFAEVMAPVFAAFFGGAA